jgi:carboxyl-terminal processing protease
LPDRLKHLESGEQYLDHSLPWDTVPATGFETWNESLQIAELRERSRARIATDEDFQAIARAAEASGERMRKTLVSLALDDLRREREEAEKLREEGPEAFHGGDIPAEKRGENLSPGEKRRIFVEAAAEDPYIEEAREILTDLRAIGASAITAGTGQK